MKRQATLEERRVYEHTLGVIASIFQMSTDVVAGRSKAKRHVQARAALCYCAYAADLSYPAIGSLLDRDHTSVRHLDMKFRKAVRNGEGWVLHVCKWVVEDRKRSTESVAALRLELEQMGVAL
jgi:chromosomal replication initiation ATPase DnaA